MRGEFGDEALRSLLSFSVGTRVRIFRWSRFPFCRSCGAGGRTGAELWTASKGAVHCCGRNQDEACCTDNRDIPVFDPILECVIEQSIDYHLYQRCSYPVTFSTRRSGNLAPFHQTIDSGTNAQ